MWKKQRKILTPTFHFKILHSYIQYFYEESQLLCNIIREEAQDGAETKTDMKLKLAGFDMIVRNVLGIQINAQRNPQHPFVLNIIETMQVSLYWEQNLIIKFPVLNIFYAKFDQDLW